jgi:hypothetical protein
VVAVGGWGDENQFGSSSGRRCFAFQASSWAAAVPYAVELSDLVRHSQDPTFAQILEEMRYGIVSDQAKDALYGKPNP